MSTTENIEERARLLERQMFGALARANSPRWDAELGEYTDEYPEDDSRATELEDRLLDYLADHRDVLGDNKHWGPYYREMDKNPGVSQGSDQVHVYEPQRQLGLDLGLQP